jgi:hypothetical protein
MSGLANEQSCECGFDGYSYCSLFPGDSDFTDYRADVQTFLMSPNLSNCNTAAPGVKDGFSTPMLISGARRTSLMLKSITIFAQT